MIKILAIGNSFSQDATRYLRKIALASGESMKVVNLYIGGCPLSRHFKNMNNDERAYSLEFNGETTGFFVSIKDALQSDEWDFVTLQQVSCKSPDYSTYQPYLDALSAYVAFHAPCAKQVLHQTWAYEDGSAKLADEPGYKTSAQMFSDIKAAYEKAATAISADRIIPSGESMQLAAARGFKSIYRDTFHASLGAGRYLLAATWFEVLTGKSVIGNPFCDLDLKTDLNTISLMQNIAHEAAKDYK